MVLVPPADEIAAIPAAAITPAAIMLAVADAAVEPAAAPAVVVVEVVDAPDPMAAATLISSPANAWEEIANVAKTASVIRFIVFSIAVFLTTQTMVSNPCSVKTDFTRVCCVSVVGYVSTNSAQAFNFPHCTLCSISVICDEPPFFTTEIFNVPLTVVVFGLPLG